MWPLPSVHVRSELTTHRAQAVQAARDARGWHHDRCAHVRTEDNAADIFTKILPRQTFEKHRRTILNLSDPTPEVPAAAMGIIRDTEVRCVALAAGGVL